MVIITDDDGFHIKAITQKNTDEILPSDISILIASFVPTTSASTRSSAYLTLSAICDRLRDANPSEGNEEDDAGTIAILNRFSPGVVDRLADVEESPLLEALSFVVALFGVDWRSAATVFRRDVFQESMMDTLELFPSSTWLPRIIASLLAQACGYKSCRAAMSTRCSSWIGTALRQTKDSQIRECVALAQVKWSQGVSTEADGDNSTSAESQFDSTPYLFQTLRALIVDSDHGLPSAVGAVEGLAYLSSDPFMKEKIVHDSALLRKLVSFRPTSLSVASASNSEATPGALLYGLSVIASNVSTYRPRLTDEETQIEKLRRMAAAKSMDAAGTGENEDDTLNDEDRVRWRNKSLVAAGLVDLLVAIVRATESRAARVNVSRAFLSLIEDKDNRGKVLQGGGAKALMTIIHSSEQSTTLLASKSPDKAPFDRADLLPVQALAKLAITASPLQVFGPNESIVYDAIRPFVIMLTHQSSLLLQRFEAMMALTNLASASPDSASRIADADGLLNKVEFLLLDENVMVRRAATELLCNLVAGSAAVFNRFSGENSSGTEAGGSAKSRLQILVALSDVEDEGTRLAASGALAILTGSPVACQCLLALELERHRVLPVLKQLIAPTAESDNDDDEALVPPLPTVANPGLLHRGVVCVRNILTNVTDDGSRRALAKQMEKTEVVEALVGVINYAGTNNVAENVVHPTAEALRLLLSSGITVTG